MKNTEENLDLFFAKKQKEIAKKLNIDISEPKQQKRIDALEKLYKKYSNKIDVLSFIYSEIAEKCNQLIDLYNDQENEINDLKNSKTQDLLLKTRLEGINFRNKTTISKLEEEIIFHKRLLIAYENKYINSLSISDDFREKLKDIENECWDNWLKVLDINRELRNNVIGYENRKAISNVGKAYVDYYILVEDSINHCFEQLKDFKKKGIIEYYEILSHFDIPSSKIQDFQIFLQKKIESKLDDSLEIKSSFGKSLENSHKQIEDSVKEVQNQFTHGKKQLVALVNYYKQFLLQKQALFTKEAEDLVFYLKKRYFEKIDILCSEFNKYNIDMKSRKSKLSSKDIDLLKKFFKDEFDVQLNNVKIKYSEKLIPLLDSFWHAEKIAEKECAFDRNSLNEYKIELKTLKIKNLKDLIDKFDKEKVKVEEFWNNKNYLLEDLEKLNVNEFNKMLENLKKDCEDICAEIIASNHRYWVKANAQFNCEARKILIKFYHQYSPWINEWREGSKSWMYEYFVLNLNSEALKVVGESLKNYSPESELYIKASKALFKYNEYSRKVFRKRDDVEFKELIKINTMPEVDLEGLLNLSNQKICELEERYNSYWENYNNFYNSLVQ